MVGKTAHCFFHLAPYIARAVKEVPLQPKCHEMKYFLHLTRSTPSESPEASLACADGALISKPADSTDSRSVQLTLNRARFRPKAVKDVNISCCMASCVQSDIDRALSSLD